MVFQALQLPLTEDQMMDKLSNGAFLKDIAAECGVSKQAIQKRLAKLPNYKDALESAFECRLDEIEATLAAAGDMVDVARGNAQFKATSWRAERECPQRWGKADNQQAQAITVIIQRD